MLSQTLFFVIFVYAKPMSMNHPNITLEKVVKGIYDYGWYPALHTLAKLERKERFEECALIKQVLDGLSVTGREITLTTKTDPESLDECFDKVLKYSQNQDALMNEMPTRIKNFEKLFS